MKLETLRIIVDERERKSGIPDLLKSVGLNIEMKTLPIGDYIVAPETIVERKSIRDLMASVFDGRLFDQCTRLKEHFENPIVLMEGNVDEIEEITENPLIFYGAISTVTLDFKIPIIPTPSASHTAKLLVSMCSRKDAPKGPYLKKIKKSPDLEKQQLSSLCSLPGI
ncbi:MAG TPA: ERCC4 domain-containing protein, partial [Nitrosopumilus sp.]|nr:ERCC4 domain-containing protein [Nitrosopumilus sp.]